MRARVKQQSGRHGRSNQVGTVGGALEVAVLKITTLGRDWGVNNVTRLTTFRDIVDQLERRT
jgi:hypothetical protein